jgi:hypothetical protein
MGLMLTGMILARDQGVTWKDAVGVTVVVVLFLGIWLLNQWGARRLQHHIDAIDSLLGEQP